ncbi:hypothetical protein [Massilia orientalis]|uniref:Uncharacterized protein n=1 Tax=Massilia orientalis TaxID=3050128 RepID=A0ACC7MFJ7_9BURK|nr:hypothetical protein [Massilia sp. YIM B02787]
MTRTLFKAVAGWFAARTARAIRPAYLPLATAPECDQAGDALRIAYEQAVVEGYRSMRGLMDQQRGRKAKSTLRTDDIAGNVRAVGVQFSKAAATLDPDGLASEMIRLFCVGVPHMDKLDNQRRVATVWSALLAPAVVMRQKRGHEIVVEHLADIAVEWMRTGSTELAAEAHASPDTCFISAHPARAYDLLTDTAKQHGLDHIKLARSVIEPVILPLGEYIGARQAADGVQVDLSGEQAMQKEAK